MLDKNNEGEVIVREKKIRARVRFLGDAEYLNEELKEIIPFEIIGTASEAHHSHREAKISTFSDKNPDSDLKIEIVIDKRRLKSESLFWHVVSLGFIAAKYTEQVTVAIRVQSAKGDQTKTYFKQGLLKYSEGWIPQAKKNGLDFKPSNEVGIGFASVLMKEVAKDAYERR